MDLCSGVGVSFRAVEPPADTATSNALQVAHLVEQVERLKQENSEILHGAQRSLRGYRREHQKLRRRNEQLKAVIAKHRAVLQDLLRDNAFEMLH